MDPGGDERLASSLQVVRLVDHEAADELKDLRQLTTQL